MFADGMVEDLTAALSFSAWMKVVAASATAAYRKGARDLRQIGRDLGVCYLLEGNVRRVSENLRVTAQLVEAETSNILWTRKFDRPLRDLAALQDDLVTEVAAHLGAQVHRAEMDHALKKQGGFTAWEALRRSLVIQQLWHASGKGGCRGRKQARGRARLPQCHRVCVARRYARTPLALSWRRRPRVGAGDHPQHWARPHARAQQPRSADRNRIGLGLDAKAPRGPALVRRAVATSPYENVHLVLGQVLARVGRSDEAIAELNAVERLAPNSQWSYFLPKWRSIAHLQAGRFEQALEAAAQSLDVFPDS